MTIHFIRMRIRIKIKTQEGDHEMNVEDSVLLNELLIEIGKVTGIHTSLLELKTGFPPKIVDLSKLQIKLLDCGIKNGDSIVVSKKNLNHLSLTKEVDLIQEKIKENNFNSNDNIISRGIMMREVMPSDNSCLFTSISFCLSEFNNFTASDLRAKVAEIIYSSPGIFTEALLGQSNNSYATWIKKDDSWGGGIELSVLSDYFKIEICVVDIQNSILNKFGEDKGYQYRIFLIYDGIHYDPLYFYQPPGNKQTVFSVYNTNILQQVEQLGKEAKSSRQYTDLHQFTLMCDKCQTRLTGQAEANIHAKLTSHCNFVEIER